MITYNNFNVATRGVFKACKAPKRKPDFISWSNRYDKHKSSMYWRGEDKKGKYVIRQSQHWSDIIINGEPVVKTKRIDENEKFTLIYPRNGHLAQNFEGKLPPYLIFCGNIRSCYWVLKAPNGTRTGCGKAYFHDLKPCNSAKKRRLNMI
ncbi:MAG: hypothetical protein LBT94_04510 [Prevotellaceae bacterium]|jgi:hypothetical protein|nr:hypothetical protein [Prevotellaceae bacterium]